MSFADLRVGLLAKVLGRDKFDRYAPPVIRAKFIAELRARVAVVEVKLVVNDCPAPDDNKFLALAETTQAELIISSDSHLANLHPWRGIAIMPPAAFLVGIR